MFDLGEHVVRRLVVLSDIAGYGSMDKPRRRAAHAAHAAAFDTAASRATLSRRTWERQTTGDGELAILPVDEPERRVVDDFVRELAVALRQHNEDRVLEARLRVRLAIVHGVADPDGQGRVEARRLVDSAPARAILWVSDAPLVVIISDRIFNDTIAQRVTSLRPADFRRVVVREKEFVATAWVRAPGADVHSLDIPDDGGAPADRTSDDPSGEGPEGSTRSQGAAPGPSPSAVYQMFKASVINAPNSVFGIRYGG